MNESRTNHSSVAIKNKLFVVGGFGYGKETCEVFDSTCKKFVYVTTKPKTMAFGSSIQSFSIGSKLITIGNRSATAFCFDIEKDEWSEVPFEATEDIAAFGCVVVPKM